MIKAWCYRHDTAEAEEIDVSEAVSRIAPGRGLVWVDCDEPKDPAIVELVEKLQINEFAREDLQNAGQRTKLARYEDHFHVAVYDCVLESRLRSREIDVIFAEGWVLSVHQTPDDGDPGKFPIDQVRRRFEVQHSQHSSADVGILLWALLDVIVDRYFMVIETVDDRLDLAEDAILADTDGMTAKAPAHSLELFTLGKALVRFRRAAVPLRDVVTEIARREVPCVGDVAISHFQDLADHVLRVADFVESQRDVLTGLRDAQLATASNRLSRSQQQIAAWGALFIVATLVTGVLGMNFETVMPFTWWEGFLFIGGVVGLICLPLYAFFKHRDWI